MFLWVECNIRISANFRQNHPVFGRGKTTVFQNDRFGNPGILLVLPGKSSEFRQAPRFCEQTRKSAIFFVWFAWAGSKRKSGPEKRVHYERGLFIQGESLESLNSLDSLESLENGRILLCFPVSGGSLETLESLHSLESLESGFF